MGEITLLGGEGSRQTAGLLPSQLQGGDSQEGGRRAFAGQGQVGFLPLDRWSPAIRDHHGTCQLLPHHPHALLLIFMAAQWDHHSLHFGAGKKVMKQRQCLWASGQIQAVPAPRCAQP